MGIEGRTVIVTGAGRGLGREYSRLFAADGAKVVVADVSGDGAEETAGAIREAGGQAVAVKSDVTDEESTLAMARAAVDEFGSADVLVNNAGIWGDLERASLLDMDMEYWDFVMGVNLKGVLLCTRAVAPHMKSAGWGRIINISSMGAYMPSGVYGVSKLGVNQLTMTLAGELGPDGITVNAVAPGAIGNEATRKQVPDQAFERMVGQTPLRRAGTAEDVYGMIRYLADDASEWVTAQTFLVNGGFSTRL